MAALDVVPAPCHRSLTRLAQHSPLATFFAIACAGTWVVLLPLVLAGNGLLPPSAVPPGLAFLLTVLGPFAGPTLAAFALTAALDGRAGVRTLLGRYVQWRFGAVWYLAAVAGPPALLMAAVAAVYGAGALPPPEQGLQLALAFAVTLAVNLVLGGILAEEPGWRGFALPRLQARYGTLVGSVVLGALWSGWHLPLLLIPGNTTWTGSFALYALLGIAFSVIHTWVSNGARSSLFAVMLLHAAINTSARLILPSVPGMSRDQGNLLLVAAYGAAALLVVALTRGRLGAAPAERATPGSGTSRGGSDAAG